MESTYILKILTGLSFYIDYDIVIVLLLWYYCVLNNGKSEWVIIEYFNSIRMFLRNKILSVEKEIWINIEEIKTL